MKKATFYLIIINLLLLEKVAYSQNFEWLDTYKAKGYSRVDVRGTIAELNGGSLNLVNLSYKTSDSISFGKFDFIRPFTDQSNYLVKLDSSGTVIYALGIGTFDAHHLCGDNEGNIYIIGFLSDSDLVGTKMLKPSNGAMIFAKFDKNFKLVWVTQTGNSTAIQYSEQFSNAKIFFLNKHLYFISMTQQSAKIGTTNYTFNGYRTNLYGEINSSNGSIKWSDFLHDEANAYFQLTGLLSLKNKLYLSGDFSDASNKKAIIGKDTIFDSFVIETDTLGKYQKSFSLSNKFPIEIMCLTTDGVHLYFGGFFMDSLKWGNKKISPQYATGGPYNRGIKRELFAASITTEFKPRWFFRPKVLDISNQGLSYLTNVKCSNGFLYFGGELGATILIDSATLVSDGNKSANWHNVLLLKSDTLGNILWATSGSSKSFGKVNTMDAIADRSVFAGGVFYQRFQLGKFKDSSFKNFGGFLTKITDYSITRGKVSNGPYCAGDTIKVPYKLVGKFDTNNVFIAELSNEQGNFDGGGRELGRLKSNKDGVVKGTLPVFQVSTSTQYRIRIRSTSPKIQSYYVTDTLRLLIYSKDKANPGPPETICMGDSLKLNTYGGTKWAWSPKYRMDDSTKRQPIVWPIKNTTYKIIIGDSSGCGAPDTAFKKVIVRPALKTVLAFKDTTVCGDGALRVPYYFTGGDSVNYRFQWYFVSNPKLWFTMKSGQNVLRDTLTYTPSDPLEKLAIILKDGCTNKSDTAYLTISQRKPVTIKSTYRDTTLCTGNLLKYKATASGGVPKQYRYQWKDLVTNSILSTTDSLNFLTKKTLKIQLIVNDGCEALGDTAVFEVKVKPELKALTNLRDTTICAAKPLNYTAQATGGNGKNYKFSWLLNSKQIDTINHLQLTINTFSTLILITKDNCSLNDTVKKTITVNPSPKADFSWDLACNKTITKFQFTGTKPNSPVTTIFHWNFNNESPSYLENPSYLFTLAGTKKISLATTSSNGCTDTIKKDLVIKPQSKADFTATDVCESDSASFKNLSQDATGYLWKFGDGQTSNLPTSKHKYNITTTTTFNVTLVAQVTNGCADSISKAVTINKNPSSDFSYSYNGVKVDLKITKSGNSYQWKFGTTDSAKTTATTYTHTIKSSDQTKVCLTANDISGCSSQTCKNVSVGILKLLKSDGFKIYPNPNSGSFTIEIENPSKDVSIEIFNLLGERVGRVEKDGKVNSLDLNVADGMYWVRVKNGEVVWNQKVSISFGVETNR